MEVWYWNKVPLLLVTDMLLQVSLILKVPSESHTKIKQMKSRMERAALQQLYKLSEEKEDVAISYLQFAMAGGYQRFFKVTTRSYETPITEGGRGDGDY